MILSINIFGSDFKLTSEVLFETKINDDKPA
jgi:hypothetical protein